MIRLGVHAGYSFDGPHLLANWVAPEQAGVVAIFGRRDDPPGSQALLYIGHSGNLAGEGFPFGHPDADCWTEHAGSRDSLTIAVFLIPADRLGIRTGIARELSILYRPPCGALGPEELDDPLGDWPDEPRPPGGVREPRRPSPSPVAGTAVAEAEWAEEEWAHDPSGGRPQG